MQAETSFTEEPKLHAHERVVEAHGGRCVGVGGNIQKGQGRGLHRGLELGKRAQCQGRTSPAGEVCQATLERAGEREELALSCKGWWEVLQLVDECNGLVSTILHVRGNVNIGTSRGPWTRARPRHAGYRGCALSVERPRMLG
jgi:hypothetical protein